MTGFELTLAGDPTCARVARSALRGLQCDLPDECVESALLVVSELVTNAQRYSGARRITLRVELDAAVLRIEVVDPAPARQLQARHVGPDAEGGRGLRIVDALAARWGCEPHSQGKCVWAELPARV